MILKNINQICQSILIFFPTFLGKVSTWFLVLMIFLTAYVVIARYVFGVGILSLQELIIYSHGITFLICAAYAMREDQHVRVDILYRRFSERRKKLINSKKVRQQILSLKQDIAKPDFGRDQD